MAKKIKKIKQRRKWTDAKAFEKACYEYLKMTEEKGEFPNVMGLSVYLDIDPKTLLTWEKADDELIPIIKKVKARMLDRKFQSAAKGELYFQVFKFDAINFHDLISNRAEGINSHDHNIKGNMEIEIVTRVINGPEDEEDEETLEDEE